MRLKQFKYIFTVAVVVAFFICWAPFHAQRLLAIYGGSGTNDRTPYMVMAFQILTYVSGIFYYLSTTVNPLLYHIMSNKFREAFKKTFKKLCRKGHQLPGGRCYSTLSAHHQSNSDSYSGCGWGPGGSIRYLEDSVAARLHNHRRPLVVSFRRQKGALESHQGVVEKGMVRKKGSSDNCLEYLEGSPKVGRRKGELKGSYMPRTKLKNSFSFSNPLIMEKLILEQSRSLAKDRPVSEINFQEVLNKLQTDYYKKNYSQNLYSSNQENEDDPFTLDIRDSSTNQTRCKHQFRAEDQYASGSQYRSDIQYPSDSPDRACSYVEVHTLRPKHICPLNKNNILQVN